jgi:hypothetical protein
LVLFSAVASLADKDRAALELAKAGRSTVVASVGDAAR